MVTQGFGNASLYSRSLRFRMTDQRNPSHVFPCDFDRATSAIAILYPFGTANLTDFRPTGDRDSRRRKIVSPALASPSLCKARRNNAFVLRGTARGMPKGLRNPLRHWRRWPDPTSGSSPSVAIPESSSASRSHCAARRTTPSEGGTEEIVDYIGVNLCARWL